MPKQSDQELPARGWELSAVESRVQALEKITERIDLKLDTIIAGTITSKQYEDRLSLMEKTSDSKLASAIREINLEYRPMAKNIAWLTRTVVVAAIGIVAQLIIFFVTYVGKP